MAEGDFVFARSGGDFGLPVYDDLWRVQDGRIVKHWDTIARVAASLLHSNGVF